MPESKGDVACPSQKGTSMPESKGDGRSMPESKGGITTAKIQKSTALAGSHFLRKKVSCYSTLSRESIEPLFVQIHECRSRIFPP